MYYLSLSGIGVETPRHAVAEPHSDGNEHVALLLLDVWRIAAVHAEHAHIERMARRKSRESEQRARRRYVSFLKKLHQLVVRAAQLDALSHEGERPAGRVDECGGTRHSPVVELGVRLIAAH